MASPNERLPEPFATLPWEIIERIGSNMQATDLLNFRMSGREPRDGSSDAFVKKFFVNKRILWTQNAIGALSRMMQERHLFRKLESLTFCAAPLLKGPTHTDANSAAEAEVAGDTTQAVTLSAYLYFAYNHNDFHFRARTTLLSLAFTGLKNLDRKLDIAFACCGVFNGEKVEKGAWGLESFMPYARYSHRLGFDLDKETIARQQTSMINQTLRILAHLNFEPRSLNLNAGCQNHRLLVGYARCLRYITLFSELENLKIDISPGGLMASSRRAMQTSDSFVAMLEGCRKLKHLELRFPINIFPYQGGAYLAKKFLQSRGIAKLERLCLYGLKCKADDFQSMLRSQRSSLLTLELNFVFTDEDIWKALLCETCSFPNIQSVYLITVGYGDFDTIEYPCMRKPMEDSAAEVLKVLATGVKLNERQVQEHITEYLARLGAEVEDENTETTETRSDERGSLTWSERVYLPKATFEMFLPFIVRLMRTQDGLDG